MRGFTGRSQDNLRTPALAPFQVQCRSFANHHKIGLHLPHYFRQAESFKGLLANRSGNVDRSRQFIRAGG